MTKSKLLIVAHPDDETIFFLSLLNLFQHIHVICVTDGNADQRKGERSIEFKNIMSLNNISNYSQWDFIDKYDFNIDEKLFKAKLTKYWDLHGGFDEVYTHGPFGEYGHPQHIQVGHYVHQLLQHKCQCYHPDVFYLNKEESKIDYKLWQMKLNLMETNYIKEYKRFVTQLPIRPIESFILSGEDYLKISSYFLKIVPQLSEDLGIYSSLRRSLIIQKENSQLDRRF